VLTVVASADAEPAAATALEAVVPARSCEGTVTGACVTDGCVDDAVPLSVELESVADALRVAGFGGGNISWETAMATSERNRAMKKRLSIQGTGS
jgi:hypothetical protein